MTNSWTLNAAGIVGDVDMVAELVQEIGAILARPKYSTGSSQLYHPGGLLLHIHKLPSPPSGGGEGTSPAPPLAGDDAPETAGEPAAPPGLAGVLAGGAGQV